MRFPIEHMRKGHVLAEDLTSQKWRFMRLIRLLKASQLHEIEVVQHNIAAGWRFFHCFVRRPTFGSALECSPPLHWRLGCSCVGHGAQAREFLADKLSAPAAALET